MASLVSVYHYVPCLISQFTSLKPDKVKKAKRVVLVRAFSRVSLTLTFYKCGYLESFVHWLSFKSIRNMELTRKKCKIWNCNTIHLYILLFCEIHTTPHMVIQKVQMNFVHHRSYKGSQSSPDFPLSLFFFSLHL